MLTGRALGPMTALLLTVSLVTACSSDSTDSTQTPTERLTAAKKSFDAAKYIGFTMSTDALPDGIDGLLSAKGTGTHAPAFMGEVRVHTAIDITAPVIAVDGKVYAKLPFSPYGEIDPATYGAPDPAQLMDIGSGISALFPQTQDAQAGSSTRDGSVVLTEIDGTLPGEAVKAVFPSAGTEDFPVTYTLTDDNVLKRVRVTGPFYGDAGNVTYTIDLDLNADAVDIQAP